jgi:hypothetical protein
MAPTIGTGILPGKPKLLDQVRDVIRRKHYSFRTEQTYIDGMRRFILFHSKRHPKNMAEREVTGRKGKGSRLNILTFAAHRCHSFEVRLA